jgi:hypothetical protein
MKSFQNRVAADVWDVTGMREKRSTRSKSAINSMQSQIRNSLLRQMTYYPLPNVGKPIFLSRRLFAVRNVVFQKNHRDGRGGGMQSPF